ncbi:hypothetical protein [Nocardia sp. NPDC046763]|uniref:hypothetical protein n=1 Tax=Nocardia sp. NPDC046763 TaxID=3155256 RepID=UPI00340FE504
MKNIRRFGLSAVGIAAVSATVALTAPVAAADTNANCPPSNSGGTSTGSSSTTLGPLINSILSSLGALSGHGTSTSSGNASSVG